MLSLNAYRFIPFKIFCMNSLTVISPAKVNLFLRVLGRRKDGYHEIVTLFHRISLCDTLYLEKIPSGIRIKTNHPSLPTDSRNLIWKAFGLLQKEVPNLGGVAVRIKKKISIGGGLGGGSSNAASFLLGVQKLYRLSIPKTKLAQIGLALGADVNFFLTDLNQAVGYGVGERLMPFSCQKKLWFVLVTFPKSISTAAVYKSYGLKSAQKESHQKLQAGDFLTKENRVVRLPPSLRQGKLGNLALFLVNDLEEVSLKLYPPIGWALQLFEQLGITTRRMSGSGSTVFAVVSSKARAERLCKVLKRKLRSYRKILIAHTY